MNEVPFLAEIAVASAFAVGIAIPVIIGESVEVAKFIDRYWEASCSRPGLEAKIEWKSRSREFERRLAAGKD